MIEELVARTEAGPHDAALVAEWRDLVRDEKPKATFAFARLSLPAAAWIRRELAPAPGHEKKKRARAADRELTRAQNVLLELIAEERLTSTEAVRALHEIGYPFGLAGAAVKTSKQRGLLELRDRAPCGHMLLTLTLDGGKRLRGNQSMVVR